MRCRRTFVHSTRCAYPRPGDCAVLGRHGESRPSMAHAVLAPLMESSLKDIYPNQLVRRPDNRELCRPHIRIGDVVYVQPLDGPQLASTIIFNSSLFGCTTYTADAFVPARNGVAPQRVRLRFRHQDIHRVLS